MAEYNWGETGRTVPSPNRPVQPNWAERGGVVSFLASALGKTQYDYQQRAQAEAQRQKDIADMARVKEQVKGAQKVEYLRGLMDKLKSITDPLADPKGYQNLLDEIRSFTTREGITSVENIPTDPRVERLLATQRKAETGDYSDFSGIPAKEVEKIMRDWYKDEPIKAAQMFVDYKRKTGQKSIAEKVTPTVTKATSAVGEFFKPATEPLSRLYQAGEQFGQRIAQPILESSLQPRPDVLEYMRQYYGGGGLTKPEVLENIRRSREQSSNVVLPVLPPPQQ